MFIEFATVAAFAVLGTQAGGLGAYEYAAPAYGLGYGNGYAHGYGYGGHGIAPIAKIAPVLSSSYTTVTKTVPVAAPIVAKVVTPLYHGYAPAYGPGIAAARVGAYGHAPVALGYSGGLGHGYGPGYGLGHNVGYGAPLAAYGHLNGKYLIRK
ncbi:keratin-associated protein 6-2-like [Galendromus occidentalis]|uniref:Keratin-associated protein 6-2-like n=1 Tax=Galendromus occidentalis TaxID=34638 RepID=A0AAJ7L570_9ACAR|nr:keratin-associated protein 6-2-like [Galendromus occidentalis]